MSCSPIIARRPFAGACRRGQVATAVAAALAATAAARGQCGAFSAAASYPAPSAGTIVAADLDGDTDLDLAVSDAAMGSTSITILLNDGDGTYTPGTPAVAGQKPRGVAVGDFDLDGSPDLAVANQDGNSMSILINLGNATFEAPVHYATGLGPIGIVVADFNFDSVPDVATADYDSDSVSIFLNMGDGTFFQTSNPGAGDGTIRLAAADMDGNGFVDLVVANYLGDTIGVLQNVGEGFLPIVLYPATGPNSVRIADLDNDKAPDVVVAAAGGVSVRLNNGDGTLGAEVIYAAGTTPSDTALGDVNADGSPDIAASNLGSGDVSILLNNGDGTFGAASTYGAGLLPNTIAMADVDDDGAPDLATANITGSVSVLLNTCPPPPDLAITKTVSDGKPTEGDEIVYTVTAANVGLGPATGVTVDDLLPAGVTFVGVDSISQGSYDEIGGVWTVGAIGAGMSATLEIRVSVDAGTAGTTGTGAFVDAFVTAGSGGLTEPNYVAFGPDGNLYVSSENGHSVRRYDGATGAFIDTFVAAGSGGLSFPNALTFGPDGNLYVASYFTDSILRYDGSTGAFIDAFVTTGSGGLLRAADLLFHSDGLLYVASADGDEVLRYDATTGAFVDVFVSAGSGGLDAARAVRFGPDGNLYVSSTATDEVLRYDGTTGAFIDAFVPAVSGGLNTPRFLRFGPGGDLFVASADSQEILRYDGSTGAFLEAFVTSGSGGLLFPTGLTFGPDGELYVASLGTDEILRYDGFITNVAGLSGLNESDANAVNDGDAAAIDVQEPPIGACCFGDACVEMTEADCNAVFGFYVGDDTFCKDDPCPRRCCLPDGTCIDTDFADCASQGGDPGPLSSSCFSDGFPCPATEACCLGDGSCADLIPFACAAQGGFSQGAETSCKGTPCPPAACCFAPSGSCANLTADDCAAMGGTYQGFGSDCGMVACPGDVGACCIGDFCDDTTQFDCEEIQGGLFFPGAVCEDDPCPRRCCLPDGTCIDTDSADCAAQGGDAGPLSSSCKSGMCPAPGACCFGDDTCLDVADFACAAAGGSFQGPGTTCAGDCPGACCIAGVCSVLTESDCGNSMGVFQGNLTDCTGDPCPQACCFEDGTCDDRTVIDCLKSAGNPQGIGTACFETSCPVLVGACCLFDGSCLATNAKDCASAGGGFQGEGSACGVNVCPGVCCFDDGSCSFTEEFNCDKSGGFYQGDGGSCDGSPCPQPGACCFLDGSCTYVTGVSCTLSGGVPQDPGSVCLTGVCPLPGVVLAEAKISETSGGFSGALGDGARFGSAVTALGDINRDGVRDVAVGSPGVIPADGSIIGGSVWVLLLNADGTVSADVRIGDGFGGFMGTIEIGDDFGDAVAAIGDLDENGVVDLAVGAPGDDDAPGPGSDSGAIWILFMNADGTVLNQQKISNTEGSLGVVLDAGDRFGSAVSALGDLDDDGVSDVLVGAPGDDDADLGPLQNLGAAYVVFLNADGTVKGLQKISDVEGGLAAPLDSFDRFGASATPLGDLDADGVLDVAIGAPGDDDGGAERGAVYVLFLNDDGTVKAEQKISALAGGFGGALDDLDFFGSAVGGLRDLNGDGTADLAVGAPGDDDVPDGDGAGELDRGAVWILFLDASGAVQDVRKISSAQGDFGGALDPGDRFGAALGSLGDLDGDGVSDLGVGAPGDDDGGGFSFSDRGAAWILHLDGDPILATGNPVEFDASGLPNRAAVGDLDTENVPAFAGPAFGALPPGTLDVAVLIPDPNPALPGVVQIFRNRGNDATGWLGFLSPALTYPVGPDPTGIALGLFDADLYLDIAVTNRGDDTVTILLNDANDLGTFTAGTPITVSLDQPSAITALQLSGNGAPDLAVTNQAANTLVIFENDGNGVFVPTEGAGIPVGNGPIAVDPLDIDNDKDGDLVVANGESNSMTIIVNRGGGTFDVLGDVPTGDDPVDLATGDLDGNGYEDPASANRDDGSATAVPNEGPDLGLGTDPTFGTPVTFFVGSKPLSIDAADLDGDGDLDLSIVATDVVEGPTVVVLESLVNQTNSFTFAPPVTVGVLANPVFVVNGDMDGNGVTDIITANQGSSQSPSGGSVTVVLGVVDVVCATDIDGNGTTNFADILDLLAAWGRCLAQQACPEDINGDGVINFADLLLLIGGWGDCD